jgi:hemolysin D
LPQALEILEKPPNPAAGWLLRIIASIVIVTVLWSVFGKVNVVSVAEGKIIPEGKIKTIQPYTDGTVLAILVTEGQQVEEGQALVELDQTQIQADINRLLSEKKVAETKRNRRIALIALLQLHEQADDETVRYYPVLEGNLENGLLLLEEYKSIISQSQELESQIEERQAELASCQIKIEEHTEIIPLAKIRLESLESLNNKGMVGYIDYMSASVYYTEQVFSLKNERKRSEQLLAAIYSAEKQLATQKAQSLSTAMNELDDLTWQLEAIDQELIKNQDLSSKHILYSPVKGSVKGLLINTVRGVVTPAQVLMEIVPYGDTLEVEAFLSNQDIGYVKAGQTAEIKVATFPFTKYGVINSTVSHVAEDATVDEALGLIYRIQLTLDKNYIMVNNKKELLIPGMAVSAEINTDKKRLIEFVLAPLLKMKDESFRER